MPALFTMISSGPSALMAPPTARSTSAALLVSAWKALPLPPALAMSATVSSAEATSRSTAATGAPADDPGPVVDHVDGVAAPDQILARGFRDARLGVDEPVAVDAHARLLDRLLNVEAEIEDVEQHLGLGLENAVGAGRADAEREGAVLEDVSRRHHGAGLAPRPDDVRRRGV